MRKLCSLLIAATMVSSLFAENISEQQALEIAGKFVKYEQLAKSDNSKAAANEEYTLSMAYKMPSIVLKNTNNVYIVNIGDDQGFVIVSGESGTEVDVLGYCDHGSFNYADVPVQLQDLLNEYSVGIDSLRINPALATYKSDGKGVLDLLDYYPSYLGDLVVEPLIKSTWNQNSPYNSHTPNQCYTGCVPTAVAQVMRYWRWPEMTKDSVYKRTEAGVMTNVKEDFSGHTYDWDNMLDDYEHGYTWEQADAVAKLMADVGKAMGTSYCLSNGSPTYFYSESLIRNFGYEPGIVEVHGETAADVREALKTELDEGRPVLYAGYPEEGDGHALICDGYTANNYFHFNYGWGGQTDGFYRLSSVPIYVNNVSIWTNFRPYDAVEKVIGKIKYGLLANGTAEILDYTGGGMNVENGSLVIPDTVTDDSTGNKYAVRRICKQAFYRKGNFDKITFGNNIETIDRFSFIYSTIDSIILSDKMEVVPDEAFQLTKAKYLYIGENVKRIGKKAFYLCPLNTIISKSRRLELDEECFANARPERGEWEDCIVKINKRAFSGATLSADTYFRNLEILGDSATYEGRWGGGSPFFHIGPKVREIAPSAFDGLYRGSIVPFLIVDSLNPYFSDDFDPIIYNKNKTSILIALSSPGSGIWPETIIKMAPGCVRGNISGFTIPPTVVDMEGAFNACKQPNYSYTDITCPLLVPPVISDATFSDEMFADPEKNVYLLVPEGTEELYAEAPGWRKFGDHISAMYEEDFKPLPPQALNYQMVVHDDSSKTMIEISDVNTISFSEDENGEAVVTMNLNGRNNITTKAASIDSITWKAGFVYDGAEIFEINDSSLTVNAHKCSITFDATTFDESAQICVRNSVLLPRPTEGVTGGVGIDISMLDEAGNAVHELSGVAEITIPYKVPAGQTVGSAYYNAETDEWVPVYFEYDKDAGVATILTDHLSFYTFFSIKNERTRGEIFEAFSDFPVVYNFNEATKILLDILDADDIDVGQAMKFKDDMGMWQSFGLDGIYSAIMSVAEPIVGYNFKPEVLDNAVSIMGEIGTALTILDVVRADIQGDNVAVASGTLKVIMAKTAGAAASAIGTPIMAASMSLVAFIGVGLEKFGTMVNERKVDLFREAYRYYYSLPGYRELGSDSRFNMNSDGKPAPHGYYRTIKDWYDYFYPVFLETDMDADKLNAYIEQSVRSYCDRFWTDNQEVRTYAYAWAKTQGLSTLMWETESLKKQISDEHYAELMSGYLVSVFAALRNKQIVQASNRMTAKVNKMAKLMGKKVAFRIKDSSWKGKEDEKSVFAGRKIGFTFIPEYVSDPDKWQTTIDDEGKAPLGWFTTYALVRNMVPFKITLFDEEGLPEKEFDFQLDGVTERMIVDIDLATQGVKVETNRIENLKLTYTPPSVMIYSSGYDMLDHYEDSVTGEVIYMNDSINFYKSKVRWCTELERFFNRHDFITVDSLGNFTIGDDIAGKFTGDTASGKFVINTDYKFFVRTLQQFINDWNNPKIDYHKRAQELLNGSVKHQIACKYTIKRVEVDDHFEYEITYTGEGAFDLTARHINHYNKTIDWQALFVDKVFPSLDLYDVGVGTSSVGGDVTLEYKTTLR